MKTFLIASLIMVSSFALKAADFRAMVSLNHLSCEFKTIQRYVGDDISSSSLVLTPPVLIVRTVEVSDEEKELVNELRQMVFRTLDSCSSFDAYVLESESRNYYGYLPATVKIKKIKFNHYIEVGEKLVASITFNSGREDEVILLAEKTLSLDRIKN